MMGSPWNPFFDQVIPGTVTRYNGRRVDNADGEQHGGFNLIRVPQNLEIVGKTDLNGNPLVLTRDYSLFSTSGGKLIADAFAAAFGEAWATNVADSVLRTAFLWWWKPFRTFGGGLPRLLYYSDPIDDNGRRYWFGAGIAHPDGAINPLSEPIVRPGIDFPTSWSAWLADDVPETMGGSPTPYINGTLYNVWGREGVFNTDIPAGSRIQSPIDLNRTFRLEDFLVDLSGDEPLPYSPTLFLRPWYR